MEDPPTSSNEQDIDTLDYLLEVKSSTCLLLNSPSPIPLDFQHPLSKEESEGNFISLNDENGIQNLDGAGGDTSSSGDSNSVVQDPVSAQLINNISMLDYQTLSKNGDLIMNEVEDCKLSRNFKLNNKKLPNFVNWNWDLIRKILLWVVLSALVACLGAIIAMVITIPKSCNPDLPWYQGKIFYEVFPASFKDSNSDGIGDFKGILKELDYIQDFGASAIRLNSIYDSEHYPDQYFNVTSLTSNARSLGLLKDFEELVTGVHDRNMFLILDIPVLSMITSENPIHFNISETFAIGNDSVTSYYDPTSAAIVYWARSQNVDGFYLKGLENYIDNVNFGSSLQLWKQLIGDNKILIASYSAFEMAKGNALDVLLARVDLLDVHLDMTKGVTALKNHINEIINGPLWSKPHYPWVHWNIGNVNSERISTNHLNNTLALTILECVLPGTISIFYGDEVGLMSKEIEEDFHEHIYTHNLIPMTFSNDKKDNKGVLWWNAKSSLEPKYNFLNIIKSVIKLRVNTATIYLNGIYKEGKMLKNAEIHKTEENLVVIERWYPRRNTCVFVGNLGSVSITTDLTSMFYGGTVVGGTNSSMIGQELCFEQVTFPPNSAIILKLEK